MSVFGYQSDNKAGDSDDRESTLLYIEENQIVDEIYHVPGRNKYVITKDNLVISADIRIKFSDGVSELVGTPKISLPVPKHNVISYPGMVFSNKGTSYFYQINSQGHMYLWGDITPTNEEIALSFMPYVAEYPIRYIDLP